MKKGNILSCSLSIPRCLRRIADLAGICCQVAVTSTWLNSSTFPDQILNTTTAYGLVVENLSRHSSGKFPTSDYLASIVKSGQPVYGTAAIGITPLSSGAVHLISVVDELADDDLLHVQAWGGINTLAEALHHVRSTRTKHDLHLFTTKLRVYSISDQDNSGIWIRLEFPSIPFIVSLHTFNQYKLATWSGISGDTYYSLDPGGPDTSLVTQDYVSKNFQIGPLGSRAYTTACIFH